MVGTSGGQGGAGSIAEVSAAIDEVHARMGDLQKATVRHVFDMREILEPEQQRQFDRKVSDALTRDPRD